VDSPHVIRLPSVRHQASADLLEELNAAIDLVASGAVRGIVLAAFPGVEDVASGALAHAQGAGVSFALSRGENGAVTIHIGPREE
jgi:hypothetical protein